MTHVPSIIQRTALVFDQLPVATVVVDVDGRVEACNQRCTQLLGWGPDEEGRRIRDLVAGGAEERSDVLAVLEGRAAACAPATLELRRPDGDPVMALVSANPLRDGIDLVGAVAVIQPLDAHSGAVRSFRSIVQEGSELIVVSDGEGIVRYVSPAMQRILGFQPGEVVGWNPLDLLHPDDSGRIVAAVATTMGMPGPKGPVECRARHSDGSWRWLEIIVTNLLDDPEIRGMVLNARDITDRKELEQQLERHALHDALTGLPNRTLLHDRVVHALERLERHPDAAAAVLLLDLDDFKRVNDTLGHEAGDRVLVAAARRLRGVVRPHDTVARLGGDEFVLVCQDLDAGGASTVASRIEQAFAEPFRLAGEVLEVRPSVGTAVMTAGDDPDEVLRQADMAMYRAKKHRRRSG